MGDISEQDDYYFHFKNLQTAKGKRTRKSTFNVSEYETIKRIVLPQLMSWIEQVVTQKTEWFEKQIDSQILFANFFKTSSLSIEDLNLEQFCNILIDEFEFLPSVDKQRKMIDLSFLVVPTKEILIKLPLVFKLLNIQN